MHFSWVSLRFTRTATEPMALDSRPAAVGVSIRGLGTSTTAPQMSKQRRSELRSTSRRRRSGLRLFVWLARALVIAVMLQFSGIAHHLVDVVHAVEGVALHEAGIGCPYEEEGR